MDTGSQIAMWLGLGLGIGAIGLINALTSEEGGITNWLMALLGLGVAGGVAGFPWRLVGVRGHDQIPFDFLGCLDFRKPKVPQPNVETGK